MDEYLSTGSELTRRELIKQAVMATTLTAGFAMAVQPVGAMTIHTDSAGLVAEAVQIPTQDGVIPGYVARPDRDGTFPIMLVVQEIFGVHEHIKDVCRRFAKRGYVAVAPELFARQGDVSKLTDFQQILSIVAKVPDAQVMSDLDSAVTWAEHAGKGDRSRLGITGFCWGGRIAWLYAAHSKELKAGVAWYGRISGQTDPLHPKYPIDIAGELNAPVLGLYGAQDQSIPVATVERMKADALSAGKQVDVVIYPDSGHAFHADYRPSYNAKDAADGESRMYAWFEKYGVI
ncbi:MAG: dienelactone hydrolase family protein [Capsulimonadaceae bacterium]|nr:dienelactone hydrolase family protein [Capsulimonadaceae bacterium]